MRSLFEQGYSRKDVLELFRFIDWIMVLPEDWVRSFKQEMKSYEEAHKMRYVTSIERLAKEEGILQTLQQNVIQILQTRFGEVPESVVEAINGVEDQSLLQTLFTNAITIGSIKEFQQVLDEHKF